MAGRWLDELQNSLGEGHASSSSIAWSSNNLIATVIDDASLGVSVSIALHVLSPGPANRQIPLTRLDLPEPYPAFVSQLKFSPDGAFLAVVAVLNSHNPRLRLLIYKRDSIGLSDRWSLFHERYLYRNDSLDVQPSPWRSPNRVLALQWIGPRRKWMLDDQDIFLRTPPRGPITHGFVLVAVLDTEEAIVLRFGGSESTPMLSSMPLAHTASYPLSFNIPQYFPTDNGPLGPPLPSHSATPLHSATVTHATIGFSKNDSLLVAYYSKYLPQEALTHAQSTSQSISASISDPSNPPIVPPLDSASLASDPSGLDMSTLDSQFLLSDLDIDMDPLDDFAPSVLSKTNAESSATTTKSPVLKMADKYFGARADFDSPDAQITNTIQLSEIFFSWDCADTDFPSTDVTMASKNKKIASITVKSLEGILLSTTNTATVGKESDELLDKTLSQLLFVQSAEDDQDLVLLSTMVTKSASENTRTLSSVINTWCLSFQNSRISEVFNSLDNPIPSKGPDDQKQISSEWSVTKSSETSLDQISKTEPGSSCLIVSCIFDPISSSPGKFIMLTAISNPTTPNQSSSHIEITEFNITSLNQLDTQSIKRISFSLHSPNFIHACISPNNSLLALSTYQVSDNSLPVYPTSNKLQSKSNHNSHSRRVRIMLLPPRITNVLPNGTSTGDEQSTLQESDQTIAPTLAMSIFSNSEPTDTVYRMTESLKTENEVMDAVRSTWSTAQKNYKGPPGPIERSPLFLELVSLQYFVFQQYNFTKNRAKILRDLLQLSSSARSFVKCRSFSRASPSNPRMMDMESVWSMLGAMQWITSYFNQVFLTISKLDENRFGEEQESPVYDPCLVLLFHPVTFSLFIQMTAPIRDFGRFLVYLRPQQGSHASPLKTKKEFLQLELAIQIYTSIVDYRPDVAQRSPEDKTQVPEVQSLTFLERMNRLLAEVGKLVGAGWQATQLEPQITAQRETFITGRLPEALYPTVVKVIRLVREYWSYHEILRKKRKKGKDSVEVDSNADSLSISFEKCAQRAFNDADDSDDNEEGEPNTGKLSPSKRHALSKRKRTSYFDVVNYQSGQITYPSPEKSPFAAFSSPQTLNAQQSTFPISQVSSDSLRKCVRCGKVSSLPALSKPLIGGGISGPSVMTNNVFTTDSGKATQGFDAFRSLYRWRCPCAGMWVGFR